VQPIDPRRLASAREALVTINSDDRDTWVRVGAAIQNEMPGQDGFSLWDSWSQASAKYDAQDCIRVWRSFKVRAWAAWA
jgi:putative DNA primase/helicase